MRHHTPPPIPWPGPHRWLFVAMAGLTLISAAGGCNLLGFAAHMIAGGDAKKVAVEAEYHGLNHQSVAVLVSSDEYTLFEYPNANAEVCRQVSVQLASSVPGVGVVDPQQIDAFQKETPFWNTLPSGELLEHLQVDRLIYVDLIQYALHEPGNTYVWQGTVMANISVASSDAANPNNLVYSKTIQDRYPQDKAVGVLVADNQTIQLGLLRSFSSKVVNLFTPHDEVASH